MCWAKVEQSPNMALQRTRRPRYRTGRSLRSLGAPLNARPFGGLPHVIFRGKTFDS